MWPTPNQRRLRDFFKIFLLKNLEFYRDGSILGRQGAIGKFLKIFEFLGVNIFLKISNFWGKINFWGFWIFGENKFLRIFFLNFCLKVTGMT